MVQRASYKGEKMTREQFIALPDMAADIQRRAAQVNRLRARLTSPKGLDTREKVQSSGSNNNMADVLIDMAAELDNIRSIYQKQLEEAQDLIDDRLKSYPDLILLTSLRYLSNRPWSDISAIMGYSAATIFRKHDTALAILFD